MKELAFNFEKLFFCLHVGTMTSNEGNSFCSYCSPPPCENQSAIVAATERTFNSEGDFDDYFAQINEQRSFLAGTVIDA